VDIYEHVSNLETDYFKLSKEYKDISKYVGKLESLLFELGAMNNSPCFKCGYNGSGYFNPTIHACATKHHELYKEYKNEVEDV
jgi:hypothetical protein